jgi:DNA (cytosine-5)-methyltransferase 1
MSVGSLCSGYGGLDMAVEQVYGGELAWVSDIDKGACKILAHRFPDVPNIGDMTAVDWAAVEPVDLICGGTPCQDLSHAGKRAGMTEGTRSNLWVAMREAVAVIRPRYVVWENVRGAYSAAADSAVVLGGRLLGPRDGGPALRALGRVLGDLSDLGYDASWHGLRAADVGAPHGRFRVFVVATDAECGGRDGWSPVAGRCTVGRAAAQGAGQGALLPSPRTSDTNGAGHHGDGGMDLRTALSLLPTPTSRDHKGRNQRDDETCLTGALLPTPLVGSTSPAAHGQISGQYRAQMAEAFQNWGQYAAAIARWETLTRTAPPPTETGLKGNTRLSPAFSEWMMGLPAGWVTDVPGITRNEALKALGNGVVPQQAAEALRVMASWSAAA